MDGFNRDAVVDMESDASSGTSIEDVFVELGHLIKAKQRMLRLIELGRNKRECPCMCVVGPTGIGKTMLLNETFSEKRFAQRREETGLVTPILRVDARPNVTTKGMAELLLRTLHDKHPSKGTEHSMVGRLEVLLRAQRTELIVIDEAQSLTRSMYAASDFLKHLLNRGICSILLVGLPPAEDLLDSNSQLQGRSLATIRLPAFDWSDRVQRQQWRGLLATLQDEVRELAGPLNLSSGAIAAGLNYATRGLLRELRQLLQEAIQISTDRKALMDVQDLAEAFERRRGPLTRNHSNPFVTGVLPEAWQPAPFQEGTDKRKSISKKESHG